MIWVKQHEGKPPSWSGPQRPTNSLEDFYTMKRDAELIRASFTALTPVADQLVGRFYDLLFARYPAVVPLFSKVEMKQQRGKLLAALALVVKYCDTPLAIKDPLRAMGARHLEYGAKPAHYSAVGECLLAALGQIAGPLWNDELLAAWTRAYLLVAGEMIEGARIHEAA